MIIIGGQYEQLHQRVNRTVLKSQNLERKGLGIAKLSLLKKKATETYAPLAKGQLISKCPFDVFKCLKSQQFFFKDFCLKAELLLLKLIHLFARGSFISKKVGNQRK